VVSIAGGQTKKSITRFVHPIAGGLAMALIGSFFLASVAVEVLGSLEQIALIKRTILYGLVLLIPALMATGASGFILKGKVPARGTISAKIKRMRLVAGNGLLILLPSAVYLDNLAAAGDFSKLFYGVQGMELAAGAVNFTLLALNMRDALKMRKARG
jgi:hypothetical protein